MSNRLSLCAWIACAVLILFTGIGYYPKWNKTQTEATISWDVSGYYFYLPAVFIYKDIRQVAFREAIHEKYQAASTPYQAFLHPSGNYVMKYSCGLAVQYLPFFLTAHVLAPALGYPADGFSRPYQVAIGLGSLLVALLGLWLLRRSLLHYFTDRDAALTLLMLVFGTNYLDYAAINGAMTHNYLFTLYAGLIAITISYYNNPAPIKAAGIGLLIGLAALTRPTEILAALIPILWGIGSSTMLKERLSYWQKNWRHLLWAGTLCVMVGSIQLLYWKLASGDWVVYSYEDQGFSWLSPHIDRGVFSFRAGWLVYTPMMAFAILGFWPLYRKCRSIFWAILLFFALFLYVTFAWDIWWYGGSLGQRAMVQSYAILAFPMAAFVSIALRELSSRVVFLAFALFFSYYNIWLTHQAHKGGMLEPGFMTRAYFWRIFLRYDLPKDTRKLLDTDQDFGDTRSEIRTVFNYDFEDVVTWAGCPIPPIEGKGSECIGAERQFSAPVSFALDPVGGRKLRVKAVFRTQNKEWDTWKMAQFIVRIKQDEQVIHERAIRVFRLLNDQDTREIYQDILLPRKDFNKAEIVFWNAESDKPLAVDNLSVERFD